MKTQVETQLSSSDICKLDDFVMRLQLNVERAENILYNIQEGYFGIAENVQKEENYWRIKSDYETYRIRTDIVSDYLFELRKMSQEARECVEKLIHNGHTS